MSPPAPSDRSEPDRWLEIQGGRLAYWRSGDGYDAIVLHGGPDFGSAYLRTALSSTLDETCALHHFDQRGTGRSTEHEDRATMAHLVADLGEVRRLLGLERPLLIAHSFGALVSLQFARASPDQVAGLILIDPDPLCRGDWEVGLREVERRQAGMPGPANSMAAYFVDPVVAQSLVMGVRRPSTGVGARRSLGPWDFRIPNLVATPTLVLAGAESIFPASAIADYERFIPGCAVVVCPDAGHFPHMEAPGMFASAVQAFVSGLPAGPSAG